MRDLSKPQFLAACAKHGFRPTGFLGYFEIVGGVHVSVLNAGGNHRAQLAYLIREQKRHAAKAEGAPR